MAKNTYGTGSFVLLNTGAEAPPPRDGPADHGRLGPRRARSPTRSRPSIFVTGAAVQWLRDGLGIIAEAAETEALAASLDVQRRRLLRAGADRARLAALGPLRARHDRRPHPRQRPRPPGAGGAEAIAYQTVDAVRAQEAAAGERLAELKADGGAVANRWLMQFQADVLGAPVVVPGDRRDDRARRRLPGRDRDRRLELEQVAARCGARRRATSRGWSEDEREALLARLAPGAWSARAAGRRRERGSQGAGVARNRARPGVGSDGRRPSHSSWPR